MSQSKDSSPAALQYWEATPYKTPAKIAPTPATPLDAPENLNVYRRRCFCTESPHTCGSYRGKAFGLNIMRRTGYGDSFEDDWLAACDPTWNDRTEEIDKHDGIAKHENSLVVSRSFNSIFSPELRVAIVKAELNVPRLMCSHVVHARMEHPRSQSAEPHTMTPLYWVNQEIRAEVLKLIELSEPTATGYCSFPWSYINPQYDTVFCNMYDGSIPRNIEAPGLRTVALQYPAHWLIQEMWSLIGKGRLDMVADSLQDLPCLKEILLVRRLPRFIRLHLESIDNKTELVRHESGFFNKVHDTVELWLENSAKHRAGFADDFVPDKAQILVDKLLDNEDKWWRESAEAFDHDPYLRCEYQVPSEDCAQHYRETLTEIYNEKYPTATVPKITMVYMTREISQYLCLR